MNNLFYRHKAEALENTEGLKSYEIIFIINVSTTPWMTKYYLYVYQPYGGRVMHQSKKAPPN